MDIIQVITDYILNDKSDGAIMINGDWGIGKSYYWRNMIVPEIENHDNPVTGKKYKCLYVSLNGINKLEDIFDQIVISKLPWTKNKISKIASSVGAVMFNTAGKIPFINTKTGEHSTDAFKPLKIDDFISFKNNILCFDDLERLGSKNTIEDVLGFINTNFIETSRVKVVFIANEKEIDSRSYQRIKEKTISRTLNFPSNLIAAKEIFSRYAESPDYSHFLEQNEEYITTIIDEISQRNLRTIVFCFDILKKIYESTNKFSNDSDLSRSIIFFSLIISQEFKNGRISSTEANNYKQLDKLYDKRYRAVYISKAMAKQSSRLENNDVTNQDSNESFEYSFYERYHLAKRKEYFFFKSIYNYILSGYLDKTLLENDFKSYLPFKEEREEVKPFNEALSVLLRVYWLNDDAVINEKKEIVLSAASKGEFQFYEYGIIYSVFKQLIDNYLIDESLSSIKSKLIEGLYRSMDKYDFDLNIINTIQLHYQKAQDEEIDAIIEEFINKLEKQEDNLKIDKFFLQLQGDYNDISEEYRYSNIFENQTADEIYDRIKGFKANGFRNLTAIFSGITKIQNIKDHYSKNKVEIPKLINKLNSLKLEREFRIDKFVIDRLINQLKLLDDRLK